MRNMHSRTRPKAALGIGALLITAALLLAGCSASTPATSSKGNGHLVVWVDATRQPIAEAYAKAHPSQKITIVTVDSNILESKLSLIANDPSALPDVVFTPSGQASEFAQKFGYSADLSKLVSSDIKKGFGATLTACTLKGAIYCLPGDISTQMLFYNKALFDKWGYTVPTTWDQYAALGDKVATEHPGYVIGSCGDAFCPNVFYTASNCPGYKVSGALNISVNLATNPDCTRVTKLLDPLIANKTMATLSPFDPDMATLGAAQKVLMLPGFVWYGALLFNQTFKNPAGVIAAAPLPSWGDGVKGTGAGVGGQWIVGAKSTNQAAAVKLIEGVTTNSTILNKQVTFPAYTPAAKAWTAVQAKTNFYAVDPTATFASARSDVTRSLYSPPGVSAVAVFGSVSPKLKSGSTLASLIKPWSAALVQAATDAGYTATVAKQ